MERFSSNVTLILTNIIKVTGLYIGGKAGVSEHPDAVVLAFAAFLITGGQVSETIALSIIERFFGVRKLDQGGKS